MFKFVKLFHPWTKILEIIYVLWEDALNNWDIASMKVSFALLVWTRSKTKGRLYRKL